MLHSIEFPIIENISLLSDKTELSSDKIVHYFYFGNFLCACCAKFNSLRSTSECNILERSKYSSVPRVRIKCASLHCIAFVFKLPLFVCACVCVCVCDNHCTVSRYIRKIVLKLVRFILIDKLIYIL